MIKRQDEALSYNFFRWLYGVLTLYESFRMVGHYLQEKYGWAVVHYFLMTLIASFFCHACDLLDEWKRRE